MSKIRLHGSSSGYTEIAPVAASSNNTITLPSDGTLISHDGNGAVGVTSITVGTGVTIGDGRLTASSGIVGLTSTGVPTSGIIQVVQVVKTDTSSTTSFASYTDIGPSASIIASKAGNKIMVEFMLNIGCTDGRHIAFRLEKDGSALSGAQGDAAGSNRKQGCFHMYQDDQNGQHDQHNYVLKYIDTAADTSAHSYNIACIDWGGQGTTQITCNRSKGDSDSSYESRTFSTCTLTELAP
tara:strand:+ start:29 stop:745 length:717 start_codon:yes stop_codon:yes gene_type:complete